MRNLATALFDVPFTKTAANPRTGELELKGYASTWALDRDNEVVDPEAFKNLDTYLDTNPILLWQHDPNKPIGQVKHATRDQSGVPIVAVVPRPDEGEEPWAFTAYSKIEKGIVRTFSIGGKFVKRADGKTGRRRIVGMDLHEISVVSVPANPESVFEAAMKALDAPARPDLSPRAVAQMEQITGMKMLTDPDLLLMTPAELAERWEELAEIYHVAGRKAPAMGAFADIKARMDAAGVDGAFRYGSELVELVRETQGLKYGRTFSRRNEQALRQHAEQMRSAAEGILTLLGAIPGPTAAAEQEEDDEDDDEEKPEGDGDGKAMSSGMASGGALINKPDGDGKEPPNLREAEDTERSCGTCSHYANRRCQLYDWPVDSRDLCDSYDAAGKAWTGEGTLRGLERAISERLPQGWRVLDLTEHKALLGSAEGDSWEASYLVEGDEVEVSGPSDWKRVEHVEEWVKSAAAGWTE